jgi:phosphoribosylformylglycinamidine synthase
VVVTVKADDADRLSELAQSYGVPLARLGRTGGTSLAVRDQLDLPLAELREAWTATLPAALA